MIPEHKYSYYYWLKCVGFNKSEFLKMVEAINNVTKTVDGYDEEDLEVCLKFSIAKPKTSKEITKCREYNQKAAKQFLSSFQKSLGGRLYLNIRRKEIKFIV